VLDLFALQRLVLLYVVLYVVIIYYMLL